MIIKLVCKIAHKIKKFVSVDSSSPLYVLIDKLGINKNAKFVFKGNTYSISSLFTFEEIGLSGNEEINIVTPSRAGGGYYYEKEVNIKFLKVSTNNCIKANNSDLIGLLNLCLLKEISSKFDLIRLEKFPEIIFYIMQVL